MTMHRTKSGWVELVGGEWRDGGMPKAGAGVACLTVHNDVTNSVWKFTGAKRDAAETLGALYVGDRERIAVLRGDHIEIKSVPAGFFKAVEVDEDGEPMEFGPDLETYPDVVAW